jgi:sterol desaturase/sphingolipid hydroxylase (fatty acid hydroxylase superfamily)
MAQDSNRASIRVFKSDLLERFTHVHPITPLLLWAPIFAYFIWRSFVIDGFSVLGVAGMGFLALALWSLSEYLLHRFIFHFEGDKPFQRRIQFMIHGLHHDDPSDPTRLVMPPIGSLILGVIFYSLFRSIFGAVWVDPFFAFFIVGYLCYDYVHYSVHHFRPRTALGRMLKQNHMNHHFRSPESLWGVSSPIWDYVFGTTEAAGTAHSPTVRHGS